MCNSCWLSKLQINLNYFRNNLEKLFDFYEVELFNMIEFWDLNVFQLIRIDYRKVNVMK